ncbi:hypothetical protein RJO47_000336 [Enterobacter hormaechei]|uniref:hypothetical protein n=1 Tax=unclassified Enterobacter cloacae complex TaxID=2757714 RepID=UPI0018729102|nr:MULTISPECIES: hypothetical protein [unclassified Enterobacter cloacae complex]ELC6559920.1 hypothetical protein [Enterobacter hormaechei]MBE4815374.1 hypothetical protein [Enterobacter cloacae complex sp. P41C]MBE4851992.1 hypothetical protein [Enterobacter cloacae complex sp. P41RS]
MNDIMKTQSSYTSGGRLCIMDDCNFRSLAVKQLSAADCHDIVHIRLPVAGECDSFPEMQYDAIIVNLHYSISIQFKIIRSLVLQCAKGKHEGPVIIITDMPFICTHALLRLAGLPYGSGENFYAIPSRLKPQQVKCALHDIISGSTELKPLTDHECNLTPLRRASLMAMIEGVPEKQQARNQNCPIKSVYNIRHIVTQQLAGVTQHAFVCGAFTRIRAHQQDDMALC